jgi:hypothetical protein
MGGDNTVRADAAADGQTVASELHQCITNGLLSLMDGLYTNVEDCLFEVAYRNDDVAAQRRCFDLMRDLRYRRAGLMKIFAAGIEDNVACWFDPATQLGERDPATVAMATAMAHRCNTHFRVLLGELAERTGCEAGASLPIAPEQIAYHFVRSLRALEFDAAAIVIVRDLFTRFVLDRLGTLYGACNRKLAHAAYVGASEIVA